MRSGKVGIDWEKTDRRVEEEVTLRQPLDQRVKGRSLRSLEVDVSRKEKR